MKFPATRLSARRPRCSPRRAHRVVVAFALALASLSAFAVESTNVPAPVTARDFYNAGNRLLAAKKYADAEKMFQSALATQDDWLQPLALYNVGHTRFDSGMDRLKQGPDAQRLDGQGHRALAAGDHALRQSESAIADKNVENLVAAYLEGRGARRQLKEAEKAVSDALATYGKTLEQWLRADGDFKSAAELNPRDTNAVHNAETVERGIAKLVDTMRKMQAMMGLMGQQRQDLGKMLSKLKGMIPAQDAPPGMGGEDDEDDQGLKPESLEGQKEMAVQQSEESKMMPSPDQATAMLNGLLLDGTRRLEMTEKEGGAPKDKKHGNW